MIAPLVSRSILMHSDSPKRCFTDTALRKYPSDVAQRTAKLDRCSAVSEFRYSSNLSIAEQYQTVIPLSIPFGVLFSERRSQKSGMDKSDDVVMIRRRRLRELIAVKYSGKQAAFVRDNEINQGELSGLLNKKSFGEKKARALECQLALPKGWLDGANEHEAVVAEFAAVYAGSNQTWRTFLETSIYAAKRARREADKLDQEDISKTA